MDRGRLRQTAAWWRSAVAVVAVILGLIWLILAVQAGNALTSLTGEFDAGAFFVTLGAGVIGIGMTVGLFLILTALLDGVAGVIDHLEKLTKQVAALQAPRGESNVPRRRLKPSRTRQYEPAYQPAAREAPNLASAYGTAVSQKPPEFPASLDARPTVIHADGPASALLAEVDHRLATDPPPILVIDWMGEAPPLMYKEEALLRGIEAIEDGVIRGFGFMNAPDEMVTELRSRIQGRDWGLWAGESSIAIWPRSRPAVERRCRSCSTVVSAEDRFCGACGTPME